MFLFSDGKQIINNCPESCKSHSKEVTPPMRGLVCGFVFVEINLSKFVWMHFKLEDLDIFGSWDLKI